MYGLHCGLYRGLRHLTRMYTTADFRREQVNYGHLVASRGY